MSWWRRFEHGWSRRQVNSVCTLGVQVLTTESAPMPWSNRGGSRLFQLCSLLGLTVVTSNRWCQEPNTDEYSPAFIHAHTHIKDASWFPTVHPWLREREMFVQEEQRGEMSHFEDGTIYIYVIIYLNFPLNHFSWSLHSNSALFLDCILGLHTKQLRLEHLQVGGSFERAGAFDFFHQGDRLQCIRGTFSCIHRIWDEIQRVFNVGGFSFLWLPLELSRWKH